MNAIEHNIFAVELEKLAAKIPKPKAILVISAHWQTAGTQVVGVAQPKTIHDFYGFPQALFAVQYPAPGSPDVAARVHQLVPEAQVVSTWGLDHGAWSLLNHLYPKADIPVLQLSMDQRLEPFQHYALAQRLKALREEGVLILGSGNVVHNLRAIQWQGSAKPPVWAEGFDSYIRQALQSRDMRALIEYEENQNAAMAAPTPEHYWPLLYAAAVTDEKDVVSFPVEGLQMGSISMLSALWQPS